MNQLIEKEFNINTESKNENNLKNEFDEELNSCIQNVDKLNYKIILEEYKVSILDKNENNKKKEELTKDEIFFIVKKIRYDFKLIDKSKYNLEIEEKN